MRARQNSPLFRRGVRRSISAFRSRPIRRSALFASRMSRNCAHGRAGNQPSLVLWLRVRAPGHSGYATFFPVGASTLRPLQQRQRTIGLTRIHNIEKGTQEFTGVRTSTLISLRCLGGSWFEQKERQNREPEKNADANPKAQIARSSSLQHRQPQHDQQRAKRRNEPQNPSGLKHVTTLTHPMSPQCLSYRRLPAGSFDFLLTPSRREAMGKVLAGFLLGVVAFPVVFLIDARLRTAGFQPALLTFS
jgi:hypothetical protein